MKEYKLIKDWNSTIKAGKKYNKVNNSAHYNYNGGNYTTSIPASIVENNKEYFEEIVEKEYEILSFKHNCGGVFSKSYSKDNSKFSQVPEGDEYSEENLLKDKTFEIYSVKRLSDGEVFSIGDKITGTYSINENLKVGPGYVTIKSFDIINERYLRVGHTTGISNINSNYKVFYRWAKYIEKTKLFTTEDGVDIFEGDYCSHVNITDLTKRTRTSYNTGGSYSPKSTKYFSTEEKAEEYIIMNKPCLSINDLLKLDSHASIKTYTYQRIKKLAKQKVGL